MGNIINDLVSKLDDVSFGTGDVLRVKDFFFKVASIAVDPETQENIKQEILSWTKRVVERELDNKYFWDFYSGNFGMWVLYSLAYKDISPAPVPRGVNIFFADYLLNDLKIDIKEGCTNPKNFYSEV